MIDLQTTHERVARRWLFKKKAPPVQQHRVPPGADPFHEDLWIEENVYRKVLRKKLVEIVRKEIPAIHRAETQAAVKAGIDTLFFNWFLFQGENWPSMSRDQERALFAIRSIYNWYGVLPDSYRNMTVPEISKAGDRDAALKALASWFLRTTMPKIERAFMQAIMQEARKLKEWAKERDIPYNKMPVLLLRYFQRQVDADRFQLKPAIQKVVHLFK